MAKELTGLFQFVKSAAEEAERTPSEEDRCVDALKLLKNFPVNYEVLVSTQVGKGLRQLTKHTNDKIKSAASEAVETWKSVITTQTLNNNNRSSGIEKADSKVVKRRANTIKPTYPAKSNGTTHHDFPTPEEAPKPDALKVETRTETVQETLRVEKKAKIESNAPSPSPKLSSLVYCDDPVRDRVREMLAEALSKVSEEAKEAHLQERVDGSDPCGVAVLVETAMFGKWGVSSGTNKAKYRSILFNIKDPKNPDFRRKVLLGDFGPSTILELTTEQMASKARQDQIEKIKERALFNSELGGAAQASTDQFKCGRCKKRQTTYYQMQTRSADEPMTTFVTCVNCNNRWKFC